MGVINKGNFIGDTYKKRVSFSKAVLWKDRQISLPPSVVNEISRRNVQWVEFEDIGKGEVWKCSVEILQNNFEFKQVGQEAQYYFPIELFTVIHSTNDSVQPKSTTNDGGEERGDGVQGKSKGSEVQEPETGNHPKLFG